MRVSVNWLRKYVGFILTIEELVHRLTMVGLEVEGVEQLHEHLDKVVTARLTAVRRHPQAERLHLCEVTAGERSYQVVCGAGNVRAGSVVALALPGAVLPGEVVIQESRIRGELSQGMLCSQKELGLGDDASGIWLLPEEIPVGVPLAEALQIRDTVLEISVTPNRADCLSIIGIAREVAALCGISVKYPEISLNERGVSIDSLSSVTVHDVVGCPRYAARVVEGVTVGPSPAWLQKQLESVGLRSINNIVDVTNYLLMEMGQPLHAFDFDALAEHRIVVRRAAAGERFTTLDGVERTLFDDTLLICDGRGPVAIAGIMGGLHSEITTATSRILIESAYFEPRCIRRGSKKLGLRTESSYRFERGVDPEGVIRALDRAAQLMLEVGGGQLAAGRIDVYPKPIAPAVLEVRVDRTNRFLGTSLMAEEMAELLRSIEIPVEVLEQGRLRVTAPTFRNDVTREVDVMEEIARLSGYNTIPSTYPVASVCSEPLDPYQLTREEIRTALTGFGFFEVINYSFVSLQSLLALRLSAEDRRTRPVKVQNPLSEDQAVLRTSLIPGLLSSARRNLDYRIENLRLFELSKVFLPNAQELPEERYHLCGLLAGMRNPQLLYGDAEKIDYSDVKGPVEVILKLFHLGDGQFRREPLEPYMDSSGAASIWVGDQPVGLLGRLHPEVERTFDIKVPIFIFELDFDTLYELRRPRPLYQPLPRFPAVIRDMALIMDEVIPVQEVLDFVRRQREPLVEHFEIFDLYRGKQLERGKKSVGCRLVFRAAERSLTDEEVNALHENLVSKVLQAFRARLR